MFVDMLSILIFLRAFPPLNFGSNYSHRIKHGRMNHILAGLYRVAVSVVLWKRHIRQGGGPFFIVAAEAWAS